MSCEISPKTKPVINELSPRKFPRSPIVSPRKRPQKLVPPKTPPQWKKPEDVMRTHRLRIKKNALAARIKSSDLVQRSNETPFNKPALKAGSKRQNPFRCGSDNSDVAPKKRKELVEESHNDATLFQLLGLKSEDSNNSLVSFTSRIEAQSENLKKEQKPDISKIFTNLPVDWTLRSKVRFISSVPFPWNQTLKTCEEASGITGFVRCIEDDSGGCNGLDISPHVEFQRCCYYWQHPNLPWLQLFPRTHLRFSESNKTSFVTMHPTIKECLQRDWSESFRSLFQLVRARHCPFFYLVTNSFNCLFRAAGINGCTETNAIISPTTRGFRKLLTDEAIEFSMPLKPKHKRASQDFESVTDEVIDDDYDEEDDKEDGAGEAKKWLASLGVGEEEIKKISDIEEKNEFNVEKNLDGNDESLIYIEGSDINALFNFLINCRAIAVTTGPLAGVPPTILSPVAFHGGTLASLKVRDNTVKVDNENFFSLELKGPIMPDAVYNLCNVLSSNIDKFSVTFANIESSKAFSLASKKIIDDQGGLISDESTPGRQTFNIENLSDCGLNAKQLTTFCTKGLHLFDCIKYTENSYICS